MLTNKERSRDIPAKLLIPFRHNLLASESSLCNTLNSKKLENNVSNSAGSVKIRIIYWSKYTKELSQ